MSMSRSSCRAGGLKGHPRVPRQAESTRGCRPPRCWSSRCRPRPDRGPTGAQIRGTTLAPGGARRWALRSLSWSLCCPADADAARRDQIMYDCARVMAFRSGSGPCARSSHTLVATSLLGRIVSLAVWEDDLSATPVGKTSEIIRLAATACPAAFRPHVPPPPRPPALVGAHVPARRPPVLGNIQPPASCGIGKHRWQASAMQAGRLPPSARSAGVVHPLQRQLCPRGPEPWLRAGGPGRAAATWVGP